MHKKSILVDEGGYFMVNEEIKEGDEGDFITIFYPPPRNRIIEWHNEDRILVKGGACNYNTLSRNWDLDKNILKHSFPFGTMILQKDGNVRVQNFSSLSRRIPWDRWDFDKIAVKACEWKDQVANVEETINALYLHDIYGKVVDLGHFPPHFPPDLVVKQVATGLDHALFLAMDGYNIYSVGNNQYGQLGFENESLYNEKRDSLTLVDLSRGYANQHIAEPVKQMVAGRNHNIVLFERGRVMTWGHNHLFQLARVGTYTGRAQFDAIPLLTSHMGEIQAVGTCTRGKATLLFWNAYRVSVYGKKRGNGMYDVSTWSKFVLPKNNRKTTPLKKRIAICKLRVALGKNGLKGLTKRLIGEECIWFRIFSLAFNFHFDNLREEMKFWGEALRTFHIY